MLPSSIDASASSPIARLASCKKRLSRTTSYVSPNRKICGCGRHVGTSPDWRERCPSRRDDLPHGPPARASIYIAQLALPNPSMPRHRTAANDAVTAMELPLVGTIIAIHTTIRRSPLAGRREPGGRRTAEDDLRDKPENRGRPDSRSQRAALAECEAPAPGARCRSDNYQRQRHFVAQLAATVHRRAALFAAPGQASLSAVNA
jgi:hypothetical protein